MRESQIILRWKNEGKVEGRLEKARETLLRLLRIRFQLAIPSELQMAVEGTNDLDTLSRWFDTAATVSALDEFRTAMT